MTSTYLGEVRGIVADETEMIRTLFHVEEFDFRIRGNCESMNLCLCKTLIAGRDQGGERGGGGRGGPCERGRCYGLD